MPLVKRGRHFGLLALLRNERNPKAIAFGVNGREHSPGLDRPIALPRPPSRCGSVHVARQAGVMLWSRLETDRPGATTRQQRVGRVPPPMWARAACPRDPPHPRRSTTGLRSRTPVPRHALAVLAGTPERSRRALQKWPSTRSRRATGALRRVAADRAGWRRADRARVPAAPGGQAPLEKGDSASAFPAIAGGTGGRRRSGGGPPEVLRQEHRGPLRMEPAGGDVGVPSVDRHSCCAYPVRLRVLHDGAGDFRPAGRKRCGPKCHACALAHTRAHAPPRTRTLRSHPCAPRTMCRDALLERRVPVATARCLVKCAARAWA